jgi:hypothetical protein
VLSPNVSSIRRAIVAELVLALAVLPACSSYDSSAPTYPTDPPPGPVASAVDVVYCRGAEPLWAAFQDGDGAWTRAQPIASGQYTKFHHDFTSTRGAFARATQFASGLTSLSILYGVPSELGIVGDTTLQCSGDALRTVTGTVAGLGANDIALIAAGSSVLDFTNVELGNTWQLRGLLPGPQELLATRGTRVNGVVSLTKMILRRVTGLADGAILPTFDFESAEAFQPVVRNLTFAGNDGAAVTAYTGLRTAHSNNFLTFLAGGGATAASPYYAIPEDQLENGELQSVGASSFAVGNVVRSAAVYFRAPADRTLTFGAAPSAPELSVVATDPTARLRARFPVQADYDRYTSINFQQGQNTVVSLSMTRRYATLAGGYELVVPELTAVEAFDPRWALHGGAQLLWTTARVGGSFVPNYDATPHEGDVTRAGRDAGFITP